MYSSKPPRPMMVVRRHALRLGIYGFTAAAHFLLCLALGAGLLSLISAILSEMRFMRRFGKESKDEK